MANYNFSRDPVKVGKVSTKNRKIMTQIPCPGTKNKIKYLESIESRSMHGQLPLIWDRAENYNVYDEAGNCWIDFTSTIFVANIGHSNKSLINNLIKLFKNEPISTYAYVNNQRILYQKKLLKFSGNKFDKAYLVSTGSEATEAALKLMRMYGQKKKKKKLGIISFEGNWHGRTIGAQMMSGNEEQKKWIGFKDKDIHHLPFPYPWVTNDKDSVSFFENSIKNLLSKKKLDPSKDLCGCIVETFQGWGSIFYPKKYIQALEKFCKKNNIILAFDEMQSGFARTGKAFGYEHYNVKPDLICCGKGMGGGLPLAGVIGKKFLMDLPEVGNMSSTHSANPLVCKAGMTVLDEITKKRLVYTTAKKGKILEKKLKEIKNKYHNIISYTNCKGLIAAIIFKTKDGKPDSLIASQISEKCMQKGLLVVHTGRESIKIGPPLTITISALKEGIKVLDESIFEIQKQFYE